jgi:hypothetical protein
LCSSSWQIDFRSSPAQHFAASPSRRIINHVAAMAGFQTSPWHASDSPLAKLPVIVIGQTSLSATFGEF